MTDPPAQGEPAEQPYADGRMGSPCKREPRTDTSGGWPSHGESRYRPSPEPPELRIDERRPQLTTHVGLRLEVPDGWPIVTPPAARALLKLLIHVADGREEAAHR